MTMPIDDNDGFDVEDGKHDDVKIPDTETESDEDMSEYDSAESSSSDDMLAFSIAKWKARGAQPVTG